MLTEKQLHTLRHMLGINTPWLRTPQPYRNYAAVQPDDQEFHDLAQLGLVYLARQHGEHCAYDFYHCTELGKELALKSFRKIRYRRAKRRYIAYLTLAEHYDNFTFMDFLTKDEYKEAREKA